jgi:uncharacterized membrane protein YeaQ/YmgE (transglycosylase-associated protein family)
MQFVFGLGVWLAIGIAAGLAMRIVYRAAATDGIVTLTLAVFGAFIGGMLGTSPYIHHNAVPLRFGGLLGAVLGSLMAAFIYHYAARKAI